MATNNAHYYASSKANALQIPDLKIAIQVMKLFHVDARGRGIQTKDDAIKIIIEHMDRAPKPVAGPEPPKAQESGLRKAIEDDKEKKAKLLSKYDSLHKFFNELPPNYQKDLKQVFPGITTAMAERTSDIQRSECTILVAGETASGKSSLINLLLGGVDLLPTSQLGCTSTICEIRTNKQNKKEAIGYFRNVSEDGRKGRKPTPTIFDLSKDDGIMRFREAVTQSDAEGDSPFDRIEITWPFAMLEEGFVIVDTPGIGGGGNMAKYAERYLSKSYGFIYVINSANAGGVQKGRLQNFMRMVVNAAGEEGFNSESTMFVCNRWDMIPEKDKEAVKQDTQEKLSRYYRELRPSQIHHMSITEASKALQYDTVIPEYTKLMGLVEKLLPESLRSRLNSNYRWMSAVLKRSLYSLKVSKVMTAKQKEKSQEEIAQIKQRIARLEQNSRDSIDYLKTSVSQESTEVVQKVMDALKSPQVAQRLFNWNARECPPDDKKTVVAEALSRISNKIAYEMNKWEKENTLVHGIKAKIIRVCKRDFELMEDQIAKLEGALLDGDTKIVQDLHKSIRKQAPVRQLWRRANEGSVEDDAGTYKGLGGALASVASPKPGDKAIKKLFSDYKLKDPAKCVAKMQDATKIYLDCIMESKHLYEKVHLFFKRFIKGIDAVAKMIPDFLKADLDLLNILQGDIGKSDTNLRELFPVLIQTTIKLLGQLDLFYMNYIMVFDYSLTEIIWEAEDGPVGSGSFADVYIADIKVKKGKMPVALKVCRDPLDLNTVSDILLEDRTLRELDHPNIVKYYGASYKFRDKRRQKDMQWIMILEFCKYTMKQKFVNPDVNNPGKLETGSDSQLRAMVTMADFALQLCDGLAYLHQKGFVHRDLKLENVLVTDKNLVKLTDVGLTKQKNEIAFSTVGSPVYMSPEVLLQSQNYDHKADIYGLAIMLWEMWYGKDAADYIQQQLFGSLEQAVKNGLRPSLNLNVKAPEPWINIINRSWAYDPAERPPVTEHKKFFEDFIKATRRK